MEPLPPEIQKRIRVAVSGNSADAAALAAKVLAECDPQLIIYYVNSLVLPPDQTPLAVFIHEVIEETKRLQAEDR